VLRAHEEKNSLVQSYKARNGRRIAGKTLALKETRGRDGTPSAPLSLFPANFSETGEGGQGRAAFQARRSEPLTTLCRLL